MNIKAVNVEQFTHLDYLEKNMEENANKTSKIQDKLANISDKMEQTIHKETKNQKTLETLTEAIDEEANQTKDLNERILRMEKIQKEGALIKQLETQFNDKLSHLRAELMSETTLSNIQPIRRMSIQEEIDLASSPSLTIQQEPSASVESV